MWKEKLSSSQKQIFFLGGINTVGEKLGEVAQSINQSKETDRLKLMAEQRVFEEEQKKALNDFRGQIVSLLNKNGEIRYIMDMFETAPSLLANLNPIMFVTHLPVSLQKVRAEMPDNAKVEDFFVAYDGLIVMVAAICPLDKRPWGVYDIRTQFLTLLKSIIPEAEMTSPCLTHNGIAFVSEANLVPKNAGDDIYIAAVPEATVFDIFKSLYAELVPDIYPFYSACDVREKATMDVMDIQEHESNLISNLKQFLSDSWVHPFRRAKAVKQMKKESANILEKLSTYSSSALDLRQILSSIEDRRVHNKLFDTFIKKVNLEEYTKPEAVDSDTLIRVIEHTRSESESFGSFVSTLFSALVGAIIGSALTIVLSYLLLGFP